MSDSTDNVSSFENGTFEEDRREPEAPHFGAVDIVEAFTAMRHEWRGQTKENRQLAEQIEAAVVAFRHVEEKLLSRVEEIQQAAGNGAASHSNAEITSRFAQLIADIDHQLTRAVQAIEQAEKRRLLREQEQVHALNEFFSSRSAIARWFSRPVFEFAVKQRQSQEPHSESTALEGLNFVLARLRRSMQDVNIERVDTEGQPFDAQTMNAIGTMESTTHPPGHVAEQLSPCYRWQGQVLRYADVRVATQSLHS